MCVDSLTEIKNEKEKEREREERVISQYYTQKEYDEMTKVVANISFEYTDNENDVVWLDSIESIKRSNLEKHKTGFSGHKLEDYVFEILKENNTIKQNTFIIKNIDNNIL